MGKHDKRSNEVVWSLTVAFEEGTHATVHGVADSPEEAATHVAHTRAAFMPPTTAQEAKAVLDSLSEVYDRQRGVITPVEDFTDFGAMVQPAEVPSVDPDTKPAFLAKTPRARVKKATAAAKKG